MPIESRWSIDVPRCSLQKWVFGSSSDPVPDKKAFLDPERPDTHFLSTDDYRLVAKRLALGFQAEGLPRGGRVLLFSGNNLFFPSLFMGVLMAGGIFTGANPTYVARELAYQLRDSGASFLVVEEAVLETGLEAAREAGLPLSKVFVFDAEVTRTEATQASQPKPGKTGRRSDGARHWTELLAGDPRKAQAWDWVEPADPENTTCCLNYSSGTTGVPKGVEISHTSYVSNGTGVVYVNDLSPDRDTARERARGLCFLPMYHAYAQTYFIANLPRMGTPVYVMPRFDFIKMLTYVQKYRITVLTCVPPIVVALAKHPIVAKFDLSSLETVGSGAAPLGQDIAASAEKLFSANDVIIRQGWGMTEVTCTSMAWDPTNRSRSSGVGEMMPNCKARIVDIATGKDVTVPDTPGELWVTGPTLMRGYWGKPDATKNTISIDADGTRWLKTGDIAYAAGTYGPGAIFHIVDRLKELIKVKGNQVAPAELEAILLERPDIVDAAVVGVTIDGEEKPRAYVVMDGDSTAKEQDIAKWLAGKVAAHKRLRGGVAFIDDIPKNPVSFGSLRIPLPFVTRADFLISSTVWEDPAKASQGARCERGRR